VDLVAGDDREVLDRYKGIALEIWKGFRTVENEVQLRHAACLDLRMNLSNVRFAMVALTLAVMSLPACSASEEAPVDDASEDVISNVVETTVDAVGTLTARSTANPYLQVGVRVAPNVVLTIEHHPTGWFKGAYRARTEPVAPFAFRYDRKRSVYSVSDKTISISDSKTIDGEQPIFLRAIFVSAASAAELDAAGISPIVIGKSPLSAKDSCDLTASQSYDKEKHRTKDAKVDYRDDRNYILHGTYKQPNPRNRLIDWIDQIQGKEPDRQVHDAPVGLERGFEAVAIRKNERLYGFLHSSMIDGRITVALAGIRFDSESGVFKNVKSVLDGGISEPVCAKGGCEMTVDQ
jgi:hypothetical protein